MEDPEIAFKNTEDVLGSTSRPTSNVSQVSRRSALKSASSSNSRSASAKSALSEWEEEHSSHDSPESTRSRHGVQLASQTSQDDGGKKEEEDYAIFLADPPKRGCWYAFSKFLGGMWASREMNNTNDREAYVRTTLRELVIYSLFLTVLNIQTFGMTSATMYYYSDILKRLFKSGNDINTISDFWTFMEGEFLDSIFWEYEYNNGDSANFICPGGDDSVGPCPLVPSDRNILFENRLLGVPRLRQLRVRNGSCELHSEVQRMTRTCFAEYSEAAEDVEPFNFSVKKLEHSSDTAWKYLSRESLNGVSTAGILGTYSGAGAVQDLNSDKNITVLILRELKEGLWISRATRFVRVDFAVYNANINLFCVVKMVFEFPATGGIIKGMDFHTVKLLRYVNTYDYIVMAFEFVYVFFILYYIVEEVLEIRDNSFAYFRSFWNILDIIVIGVSCVNVFLIVYSVFVMEKNLEDLLTSPDKYADFSTLGFWASTHEIMLAICLFFSWIKLLKYITFNKTMVQLTKTLSRAGTDLVAFGLLFMLAFMAYAQFGYFLFQSRLQDFSTLTDSVFTLLRTILGDFDFHAMNDAEPILGPFFFVGYVMVVFFVMLNMFLAIINDTYSLVKAEIAVQALAYQISDYLMQGYNNLLGRAGGTRDKGIDMENALKLANADGIITYDEVRQNLKKANFSDLEIEVFFAKYDKDGNGHHLDTSHDILDDMDDDKLDEFDEDRRGGSHGVAQGKSVTWQDLYEMSMRVDAVDVAIGDVIDKLEGICAKFANFKEKREEKRSAMDEIFDPAKSESELAGLDVKD